MPLVFHHTAEPDVFVGLTAGDEAQVEVGPGDQLTVDVIGPGQAVTFGVARVDP
jgi:hypothetical protein